MKVQMIALFLSSVVSMSAFAQATPAVPTTGTTETTVAQKTDKTDEADQLITNRQLRASTGSLSKWSMNSFWQYQAGSVSDPFNVSRPNITAAGDIAALHNFSGEIGARYRISAKDSLSASIGLNMAAPFHGSIDDSNAALKKEFDQNAGKLTAKDPSLTYRHLERFLGNLQSVTTLSFYVYSTEFMRNSGFRNSYGVSQNFMYEFGKSGLSAGGAVMGTAYAFGGDADTSKRPGFVLGFYPAIEYVINDKLNLRTVSGVWVNEFRRNGSEFRRIVYQSVGLGISITRDIFLYPNIQFLPGDLRAEKTNLGLNANVNLF